jgi:L-asparaginase II
MALLGLDAPVPSRAVTRAPNTNKFRQRRQAESAAAAHAQYVPAIEVTRGAMVESVHCAALAVVHSAGKVVGRLGGIGEPVFLRSSAKPIQAMAVIESGAAEKYAITPAELAVICGSHSSEAFHVQAVAGLLGRLGLSTDALQCGTHTPFSKAVAEQYRKEGRPFTALEHNCSGKHAGMLASALAGGHDPARYLEPTHPVQQRIMGILADLTGRMRDRIAVAVDGCSAPTFGVSLDESARALARMADPERLDPKHRDAARSVIAAMRAHPEMVGGTGTLDTELTALPKFSLICKRGAEGVQCAAYVRDGLGFGLAAKVGDGDNYRARIALTIESLRQLGVIDAADIEKLTETSHLRILNNRGREVGQVRGAFATKGA